METNLNIRKKVNKKFRKPEKIKQKSDFLQISKSFAISERVGDDGTENNDFDSTASVRAAKRRIRKWMIKQEKEEEKIENNQQIKEVLRAIFNKASNDDNEIPEKETNFKEAMKRERLSGKKYWKVIRVHVKEILSQYKNSSIMDRKLPTDGDTEQKEEEMSRKSSSQENLSESTFEASYNINSIQSELNQDTIDNLSSITYSIDNQDVDDSLKIDFNETSMKNEKETNVTMCLPLQSNDAIIDRGDTWRIWSCIRLSYLLRDTLQSLSKHSLNPTKNHEKRSFRFYVKYGNKLNKRGHYFTRREERYCWLTVKQFVNE